MEASFLKPAEEYSTRHKSLGSKLILLWMEVDVCVVNVLESVLW